jgi:hypothetical protein
MLRSSWVAAQLAASQERLSSMNVLCLGISITVLGNVISCNLIDGNQRFGRICLFHLQIIKVKVEGAGSSETLVPIYQIQQRHIPQDLNLVYCWGRLMTSLVDDFGCKIERLNKWQGKWGDWESQYQLRFFCHKSHGVQTQLLQSSTICVQALTALWLSYSVTYLCLLDNIPVTNNRCVSVET